jgi:hypothetical protein
MGFLDKLLGRGKQLASETAEVAERAVDRGKEMLDRDDEPAAGGATPPSEPAASPTPPAAPTPPATPPASTGEGSSGSGGSGGAA